FQLLEVDPPGAEALQELVAALLVSDEHRGPPGGDPGEHELHREVRLADAGGPRDQGHRILEQPAAEHLVEHRVAGRDPLAGGGRAGAGNDGDDDDPLAADDPERELTAAMVGTPQLERLEGPPANAVMEGVPQDDDVVGDELLHARVPDRAVVLRTP